MGAILANHYVLAVHDLRASADWFTRVLGFAVHNEPPGWVFLKRNNCMVMLGECKDAIAPADLGDHSYFGYLMVDDADAFYAHIQEAGEKPHMHIANKPWGMREFALRTVEGHRINVGQLIR